MPPKRCLTCKRGWDTCSPPNTDEGPSMRHSQHSSTRLASQGATLAQPHRDVEIPVVSQQQPTVLLPPDLMGSIVSTVAAEVNKQLAARQHQEALQRPAMLQTSENNTARVRLTLALQVSPFIAYF